MKVVDTSVVVMTTALLSKAVRIAKEYDVTVYDAVYASFLKFIECV